MTTPNPMSTSKKLAIALSQFGLDICVPFHAEFYNEKIREGEQQPHLPSLSPTGNTLSLLIANSRLLWTKFTQHIIENPGALDSRNPLDDYVRTAIDTVIEQELDQSTLVDIRFAYDRGPKFVAFQKLAHAVGEAYYNQQAFLCSHPRFGPWQALRAVITIGIDAAMDGVLDSYEVLPDPHPEGAKEVEACMKRYFEVVSTAGGPKESGPEHVYRYLVAARDAATREDQRQYRYSEDQIEYHYTKNKGVLRRIIESIDLIQ